MSEQNVNSLFGMFATKETPIISTLKKNNVPSQSSVGKKDFLTELGRSIENLAETHNQAPTQTPDVRLSDIRLSSFEASDLSFLSLEGIKQIIEMASKGISTDNNGNQIHLKQELTYNNKHTHTLNQSGSGQTPTLLNASPNNKEMALLAKSMSIFDSQDSTNTNNKTNKQLITQASLNSKEIVLLAKSTGVFDSQDSINNSSKINEQLITNTLSKTSPVEINTNPSIQQAPVNNDVRLSSVEAKELALDKSGLGLANHLNHSKAFDTTTSANNNFISNFKPDESTIQIVSESDSLRRTNTLLNRSSLNKEGLYNFKEPGVNIDFPEMTDNARLGTRIEKSSQYPNIQPSMDISNDKILEHNVLTDSKEGINKRINEQLLSQYSNKTSPANINTDELEAEKSRNPLHILNASKSLDTITSDNNVISNADSDKAELSSRESVIQTTTPSNNSFLNNQGSDTAKEPNINILNVKQGTESETSFTNALKQTNETTQTLESSGADLADNIFQRAKLFMRGGKSEIRIQLNPPELGSLELEFSVADDLLEAKISVQKSIVRDIIEKDIPRLRELISNADINVGKMDVFLQEKGDERMSFMNKGFQSNPENHYAQDSTNQENEYFNDEVGEDSSDSDETGIYKINYLL